MQLIQKLKVYFKDAIKQENIVRLTRKSTSWTRPLNQFVSSLNCDEWEEFEEREEAFRISLSCQGTFYDQFICNRDFTKWRKRNILREESLSTKNPTPFGRCCIRILNSMPHEPSREALNDGISIITRIEKQICYVIKITQPFFSSRQGQVSQRPVSRNK